MNKRILSAFLAAVMVLSLVPALAFAAESTEIDTDWYSAAGSEFVLSTPAELAGFAAVVNGTASGIAQDSFAGKTVKLGADIDLEGMEWTPIAAIEFPLEPMGAFSGTFDGGEYSISNLSVGTADYHAGLFGYTEGATVKNVKLIGAKVTAKNEIANAILIPFAVETKVIGCSTDAGSSITFDAAYSTGYDGNVAGMVSYLAGGLIQDCVNNAAVIAPDCVIVAGIVAQTDAAVQILNCVNNGEISGYDGVGGILGQVNGGEAEIADCANTAAVTGASSMVGGIAGCLQADASEISACYNTGAVTGTYEVGGVVGNLLSSTVRDCYNAGSVTSTYDNDKYNSAGGIAGVVHGTGDTVSGCHNVGTVSARRDTSLGELVGQNKGILQDCAYLSGKNAWGSSSTGTAQENTAYTAEQFANGEVMQALNAKLSEALWKQTVGADAYPVFEATVAHSHDGKLFTEWTAQEGELTSGNYYLSAGNAQALTGNITVPQGETVTLCLNGHTLDMGEAWIENLGTLTVCDCSEGELGTLQSAASRYDQGAIYNNKGSLSLLSGRVVGANAGIYNELGTVTVSGGTVSGGDGIYHRGTTSNGGTIVSLHISGGRVIGSANGFGTGIYVALGSMEISGGTVSGDDIGIWMDGNPSNSDEARMTGGEVSGVSYGMYLSNGTALISGGTVTGSGSDFVGYGVSIGGGLLYLSGSPVLGGAFADVYAPYESFYAYAKGAPTSVYSGSVVTVEAFLPENNVGKIHVYGGTAEQFSLTNEGYLLKLQEGNLVLAEEPHVHDWSYTANGASITAECIGRGTCDYPGEDTSLSLVAPDKTQYGDNKMAAASLSGTSLAGLSHLPQILYAGIEGTDYAQSTVAPENAGSYAASITVEGVSAKLNYSIEKATLDAPANLRWEDTSARWDGVESASGYSLTLYKNGVAQGDAIVLADTGYRFTLAEGGKYTFRVKAVSGNGNYADSTEAFSEAFYVVPDAQIERPGEERAPFDPNRWYSNKDMILPPGGYMISSQENDTFGEALSLSNYGLTFGSASIIYYLRDSEGNVTAKRFENLRFDDRAPVVLGIKNGKTYCGAVVFTVDEDNLDSVSVQSVQQDVTKGSFTVNPADGEQTVTVLDKAGNLTVTVITVNAGHSYFYDESTQDTLVEKCHYCDFAASAQILAPVNDLTYNGAPHNATVLYFGTLSCGNGLAISYGEASDTVNAGDYTASIRLGGKTASVSYTVNKAVLTPPAINPKTYNGSTQTADVTDTRFYTVTANKGGTDVGQYGVVLTLKDSRNFVWAGSTEAALTLQFEITGAANAWVGSPSAAGWTYGEEGALPEATAQFGSPVFTYFDSEGKELSAAPRDAGSYTVKVSVSETVNYTGLETELAFTVAQRKVTVKWTAPDSLVYDGTAKLPTAATGEEPVKGDAPVITVKLTEGCDNVNAGSFTFAATGISDPNYVLTGSLVSEAYTLTPRPLQEGDFTASVDGLVYTGSALTPAVESGTPLVTAGDYELAYENNVGAGEDSAKIVLTGKGNASGRIEIPFSIAKAEAPNVAWPENLLGKQGDKLSSVALPEGFSWVDGNEEIRYGIHSYSLIFTPEDCDNYLTAQAEAAVNGADVTAPTGTVSIGENSWNSFWNKVSFGLFFKDTQTVTVTAGDTESGVAATEYYLAAAETDDFTGVSWTAFENCFDIEPDNRCVVYIRITDRAGCVSILNSDGIVLDHSLPVISGIENGKEVYGDASFTVDEENPDAVSIDGKRVEAADGKYTITADNKEHTVLVSDKAGNCTEYKLKVYKLYTLRFLADGKEIAVQLVGYGKDAVLPQLPEKEGFTAKWSGDGKNITADLTLTAEYTRIPETDPPATGDKSEWGLWIIAASALAAAALSFRKKKHLSR